MDTYLVSGQAWTHHRKYSQDYYYYVEATTDFKDLQAQYYASNDSTYKQSCFSAFGVAQTYSCCDYLLAGANRLVAVHRLAAWQPAIESEKNKSLAILQHLWLTLLKGRCRLKSYLAEIRPCLTSSLARLLKRQGQLHVEYDHNPSGSCVVRLID